MFKKTLIALATVAAFGATSISSAYAINLGASRGGSKVQRQTSVAPIAFSLYCLDHIAECTKSAKSEVAYTSKIRNLLASVNRSVNRSIRPLAERRDVWSLNPPAGDCDDYVMTKRSRLIRAGIPASALRVAVVRTRRGEGHAILLVKTSAGEFALDNLRKTIVKRSQTGYRFLRVASADPTRWTAH